MTYPACYQSKDFPLDGLMGLGLKRRNGSSLLETLFKQGALSSRIFGLKLHHSGPELFLGGVNRGRFSRDFIWLEVPPHTNKWEATLRSISVDGREVVGSTQVSFDTSSGQVRGDKAAIAKFFANIKGAKLAEQYGIGTYISASQ